MGNIISNSNQQTNCKSAAEQKDNTDDPLAFAENPGRVADIHDLARNTQPMCFDGLKFVSKNLLTDKWSLGHVLQLGKREHNIYRLNATYCISKKLHPFTGENMSLLMTEIDSRGGFTAGLHHFVSDRLRCKFTCTLGCGRLEEHQLFADYLGKDYTLSCVLGNLNPWLGSGMVVTSYLKRISQPLELGWELIWQGEDGPSLLSGVARYARGDGVFSGTINRNATELCYTHNFGPCLRACAQIQANFWKQSAVARLSYHLVMPHTQFTFRGGVDSRGVISAVCEKRLEPLPLLLVISGKMNHVSNHFRLGVGAVLD
ncbi:hypothetical protein KR009_007697 [Drosophila setifemur]|nr:hypothetical protein KR009_007697 [Drosophila setifemur]